MPREAALETLRRVERGALARETLDGLLRRRKLDARDRDLARELVQGVLRHQESLDHLLAPRLKRPLEKAHALDRNALRLGAYQIVYLDRIPVRAAVHSAVEAVKTAGRPRAAGFVNAVLRKLAGAIAERGASEPGEALARALPRGDGSWTIFSDDVLPDPASEPQEYLSAAWSCPGWLVERFVAEHGEEAARAILEAGVARPAVSLRPAPAHAAALRAALAEREIVAEQEGPCLLVRSAGMVSELPGYGECWFAVQDPTAAEVVPLLSPEPGEGILDLCAAPGGKTMAIADGVGPDGVVMAVDLAGPRLKMLEREVKRRGLAQVAVLGADVVDPEHLPTGLKARSGEGFDAVLIDVPCSNTGVLGQRVEARRRLDGPHRIEMLAEQAQHLLMVAASRVRPGGRLVYSTCSLEEEENHLLIQSFLHDNPTLGLRETRQVLPFRHHTDGAYAALLMGS
jgi:16S rRNA (cytosine967-C5)-methyltransferase